MASSSEVLELVHLLPDMITFNQRLYMVPTETSTPSQTAEGPHSYTYCTR